jgi:hypothetical protein
MSAVNFKAPLSVQSNNDQIIPNQTRPNEAKTNNSVAQISKRILVNEISSYYEIVVKPKSIITGLTKSFFRGIVASESTLEDMEASFNIELTNCKAKNVKTDSGEFIGKDSTVQDIIAHSGATLTKCSARSVNVKHGDCEVVDSQIETTLDAEGSIDLKRMKTELQSVISTQGKISLKQCKKISKVAAQKGAILEDTEADEVDVLKGPLKVTSLKVKNHYNSLKAFENIDVTNISASEVKSSKGAIKALMCKFDNLAAFQTIAILKSTVSKNIILTFNPSEQCKLLLANSIIEGDLIIDAIDTEQQTKDMAEATSRITKSVYEKSQSTVVKTLAIESATLAEAICSDKTSAELLTQEKLLPQVSIEIEGGTINGKVIFKNCEGTYELTEGAQVGHQ